MSRFLLLSIAFIEGFASLGTEVIALRRLLPYMGSSITVTAPTIGLFLLALACGYACGGRVTQGFLPRILRNFVVAALLIGVGLSSFAVLGLFAVVRQPWAAYAVFMAVVVCPSAWLTAQTVPMLTNLLQGERAGAASGAALTASTAGSVLGAVALSLGAMQLWGVWAAVLICCASLCVGVAIAAVPERRGGMAAAAAAVLAVAGAVNAGLRFNLFESAYADYSVQPVPAEDIYAGQAGPVRVLAINAQGASSLDASSPPKVSPYVERLRRMLREELAFQGKDVLVLGAGGFTLSIGDRANRYTYVDIDPTVRTVAERDFLKGPVTGEFVVDDARRFVARTGRRFDAVVVDVFSAQAAIPSHLLTAEFWQSLPRVLNPDGIVMINLILDPELRSPFARNVLSTIEQALGRCAVEVLFRRKPASNVEVSCQPGRAAGPAVVYTDERNRADLDRGLMGY